MFVPDLRCVNSHVGGAVAGARRWRFASISSMGDVQSAIREEKFPKSSAPALRTLGWILVPSAGAAWSALGLRRSWFFYDEWSMIDRVMHTSVADGIAASFNDHLLMLTYVQYRLQVSHFGIGSHVFACAALVVSLLLMHLAITALLRACSVPLGVSLLAAGLVTYLGVGSQNSMFAFQTPINLVVAMCSAAVALAVARPPTLRTTTAIAVLLLAAVGTDSGQALPWVVYAAVVMGQIWRNRYALSAVPALLALGAWFLTREFDSVESGSIATRVIFSIRLLLRSFGGLVGGAEAIGVVLMLVCAALVVVGVRRGVIDPRAQILFRSGILLVVLMTAAIAQSRGNLVGSNFVDFNRYLQAVAVPIVICLLPLLTVALRALRQNKAVAHRSGPGWRSISQAVPSALILVAFSLGLGTRTKYAAMFDGWNIAVEDAARSAAVLIRDGCPPGRIIQLDSAPAAGLSPQMSTRLIGELMERGAFAPPAGWVPVPSVVERVCPESGVSVGP